MLIDHEHSSLLVVDVQERLLPAIDDWQRLLDNVIWLVQVAQRLQVPILASEQYPKGLGLTHADLRALLPVGSVADKVHFSCVAADCLDGINGSGRRQIVICGIEAHVCVMQTALELRWQGKEVFVVADAVASRHPADRDLALSRMRGHGIEIVSREMVAFEWLRRAGTTEFRQISSEFLR
jgi:nicotinamidase-related amidase